MYLLVILCAFSFLVAFISTPLVEAAFRRLRLLDQPDQSRKLHDAPVPRVGGIPIAIAYGASFGLLYVMRGAGLGAPGGQLQLFLKVLPAVGIVFLTGLLDDLRGLKPSHKLIGQFLAAGWAYYVGVRIMGNSGLPVWMSLPLTILWLVACTNAFNLIDGLDGLASGIGLLATLTTVIAAVIHRNLSLAMATVPLAGSLMGFLKFNFNPASIFLGDSGSLSIGFLLGCFGVVWSQKAVTLLGMMAPLMALAIPVLDVSLSIMRRYLRKQPIFSGDRGHIHHRLLAMGMTPKKVAIVLYGAAGLGAAFSLMQSVVYRPFEILVVILFCGLTWIGIQQLRYVEFDVLRRMLMGGEFRRILNWRIRLQLLETALAQANTTEECWLVIRDASREFGFFEVSLKYGDAVYYDRWRETEVGWHARVTLSQANYVDIVSSFRSSEKEVVGPFISVVQAQMQSKDLLPAESAIVPVVLQARSAGAA